MSTLNMIRWTVLLPALAFLCAPAHALVPAQFRLQKVYGNAGSAFVGKIATIRNDDKAKMVEIESVDKLKGEAPAGGKMLFFLGDVGDADLFLGNVKVGDKAVVILAVDSAGMVSRALLHVGDSWFAAAPPAAGGRAWRTQRDNVLPGSFPGSTAALELLLRDLTAGKDKFLNDELDGHAGALAKPNLADLGTLGVKPIFVLSTGGAKPDLVVGTPEGVKLFARTEAGYQDATAGTVFAGKVAVAGVLSGTTILLDGSVAITKVKDKYMSAGGEGGAGGKKLFALGARPDGSAIVVGDVTPQGPTLVALPMEGGKPDAKRAVAWGMPPSFTIIPGGLSVDDWTGSGGKAVEVFCFSEKDFYLWAASDPVAPPASLGRFTGIPRPRMNQKFLAAAALDVNADGRPDLYLALEDGKDWVVVNRGYGCFFPHNQPALVNRSEWKVGGNPVPPPAFVVSADLDGNSQVDILYVAADGKLTALMNPFAK